MNWNIALAVLAGLIMVAIAVALNKYRENNNEEKEKLRADLENYTRWANERRAENNRLVEEVKVTNDKLNAMHLAAMRFCAHARDIYGTHYEYLDEWTVKRIDDESGKKWYMAKGDEIAQTYHGHTINSWKPTAEEWTQFANNIVDYVNANQAALTAAGYDRISVKNNSEWIIKERYKLGIVFLCDTLRPLPVPEGTEASILSEVEADLRLIRFLDGLRKVLNLDEENKQNWTPHAVDMLIRETTISKVELHKRLTALKVHRNTEFMQIMTALPVPISHHFLRLTVEAPTE